MSKEKNNLEPTKKETIKKIILIAAIIIATQLIVIAIYRKVKWPQYFEAVNGDSIKVGEYTAGAFLADYPSTRGYVYANHAIGWDVKTGEDTTYDFADIDIRIKPFGYDISVSVCYRYQNEDGSYELRRCKMELDENMNYIDGEYGSKQIYEEYFEAIKEVYQVAHDVWGIVNVKESL